MTPARLGVVGVHEDRPDVPLRGRLRDAIDAAATSGGDGPLWRLFDARAVDRRDRITTLLDVYELRVGGSERVGASARYAEHPAVAAIKWRLERSWLTDLLEEHGEPDVRASDVVDSMRVLAARDRLPAVYRWVADDATWLDVVQFLALEGGPDAGFDDLVAACQVGLPRSPKLELARNFWDEMGNGDAAAVHTTLYERFTSAIGRPHVAPTDQPLSGLERAGLGGLLATNRWLQPEMVGALGLTELQAGPRCRMVLRAFDRCGSPADAYPFYRVHADVDPRHGRDWLDNAVAPLVGQRPDWGARVLRGAWWRSRLDAAFFDEVHRLLLRRRPAA